MAVGQEAQTGVFTQLFHLIKDTILSKTEGLEFW
ncbi:hypothetical protein FOQG_03777 [Fusarium oxysporum f. sp. raphani 54005]|uniref:Uncharacterized protein n=8 Tax=Fusarium oxysporum TaxID=5507 RepID=W9HW73_FUSOX|nr:hypothetical protein FOXG_20036 [Fusarium oxysporum f. sp. lycopersici 4287]EWY86868.1 hypothetical protein FOYG_11229 [Fusarium oxysporum NRRL 32931]EWZ34821.1 hypothetical protein FOZG_12659 [Fusarium oxysporum Fo47]EWZ95082.1 hypothetical protein FOWG_05126 [Fusarium oxysporum f. sp. lycopersici MN25]EXA38781.1 hypothetical protein FOVG_10585 [Fusarium oxysporum f. sp. pisi HDV247]EXK37469.1 hypothetical protein FOMG_08194 [Fusarium oxysporum f. sp. melonis 26406]EXK95061.1 hypothetical